VGSISRCIRATPTPLVTLSATHLSRCYSTDSSLSREMRALGPVIEDVDLSDTEEADITVVEVEAVDVTKTSTNIPSPQGSSVCYTSASPD